MNTILNFFLSEVKKQGFTIILLLGGMCFLYQMVQRLEDRNLNQHKKQDERYEKLELRLDDCHEQHLKYIRDDRDEVMKVLKEYTDVLKTLKR